ncbi:coiled-coil domain-containing protein 157 isoform X1 [Falco biarmicus]|uniref:coiled-coil domain-containing protein 157 isoform X1 n=1 Tax=Falco biarmicus TaxID=345155 RepID=UPI0024BC84AB|nr:coiled-coil domain-containing protein 157 isoform X1 [Falco biarmicus]
MAHLLGHRGCMESLRADLRDLQAAIADVSSRAGAVRFPSWKFPDKVSCELDLAALLERYGYTEGDPAFSQHSHVVLLELLIDRLLLLLQTFTGYAENLLSEQATPLPQAVGPCMSAGRTARTYWHSMLKLGAFHQQLLDERLQLGASSEVGRSTSQCPPSSVPAPGSSGSGSPVPRAARSTAESSRSISTQTTRSFLEPCATCASAQASLREVGQTITSICQSQNIPSALSRFQELVDNSTGRRTLSARDVSCWASEQSKDLSRISKHLQALLQQVSPLKAQLEDSEKQRDELQKQVEDISKSLQAEKKRRAQQRKEAEQRAEARRKEHLAAVARLERDKDELRRGAAVLEERLSALQEELAVKRAAVQELARPAEPAAVPAQQPAQPAGHRVSRNPEEGAGDLPSCCSPLTARTVRRRPQQPRRQGQHGGHVETKTRPCRSSQWPQCSQQPAGSHLPEGSQWPASSQRLAAYGHSRQSPPASPGPCLSLLATGLGPRLCETGTERTRPPLLSPHLRPPQINAHESKAEMKCPVSSHPASRDLVTCSLCLTKVQSLGTPCLCPSAETACCWRRKPRESPCSSSATALLGAALLVVLCCFLQDCSTQRARALSPIVPLHWATLWPVVKQRATVQGTAGAFPSPLRTAPPGEALLEEAGWGWLGPAASQGAHTHAAKEPLQGRGWGDAPWVCEAAPAEFSCAGPWLFLGTGAQSPTAYAAAGVPSVALSMLSCLAAAALSSCQEPFPRGDWDVAELL